MRRNASMRCSFLVEEHWSTVFFFKICFCSQIIKNNRKKSFTIESLIFFLRPKTRHKSPTYFFFAWSALLKQLMIILGYKKSFTIKSLIFFLLKSPVTQKPNNLVSIKDTVCSFLLEVRCFFLLKQWMIILSFKKIFYYWITDFFFSYESFSHKNRPNLVSIKDTVCSYLLEVGCSFLLK